MKDAIEFVHNYSDLSTNQGFQFEFHCNRCGTGYRTKFKPSKIGMLSGLIGSASNLLGGVLNQAAGVTEMVRSAQWEKAHDTAFEESVRQMKPDFIRCPRCNGWVCRKNCWNDKRGLCKGCAPDLGVEMSAAQASRSVEEVWAHACMADSDRKLSKENWKDTIKASCPECEAPLASNAKFCPECGTKLKGASNCIHCDAELPPKAKFCLECGEKVK